MSGHERITCTLSASASQCLGFASFQDCRHFSQQLLYCSADNPYCLGTKPCNMHLLYQRASSAANAISDSEEPLRYTPVKCFNTSSTLVCAGEEYPSLDESKYVLILHIYKIPSLKLFTTFTHFFLLKNTRLCTLNTQLCT